MTLNITVAAKSLVCLSSDFRLTYPSTGHFTDHEAQKIVFVWSHTFNALVQFCGLAKIGALETSIWLGNIARGFPKSASRADLISRLMKADAFARGHRLTFTVAGFEDGRPFAHVISTYDHVDPEQGRTRPGSLVCSSLGAGVHAFATGMKGRLKPEELRVLRGFIRGGVVPQNLARELARLNAQAAARAGPSGGISKECFTGYLAADGSGEMVPHGIPVDQDYMPTFATEEYTSKGWTLEAKRDANGKALPRQFVAMSIKSAHDTAPGGLGRTFLTLSVFSDVEPNSPKDAVANAKPVEAGTLFTGWQHLSTTPGVPMTISLSVTRGPINARGADIAKEGGGKTG